MCVHRQTAWKPETAHVYPISEGKKMHTKRAFSSPLHSEKKHIVPVLISQRRIYEIQMLCQKKQCSELEQVPAHLHERFPGLGAPEAISVFNGQFTPGRPAAT